MRSGTISASGTNTLVSTAAYDIPDDILFTLGDDSDIAIVLNSAGLASATELTGVFEGTSVKPTIAASTLIISNITNDGDIIIAASDGGNSKAAIFFDASAPDLYLYNVGGTWTAGATTWTIPAVTLGGAVAGGDQAFTGVGDMTFTNGSILASGSTTNDTLLLRANDTTFITFTTAATDVCTLDGVTLKGTLIADGTVTLPAVTLGGAVTIGGQQLTVGTANLIVGVSGNDRKIEILTTGIEPGFICRKAGLVGATNRVMEIEGYAHDGVGADFLYAQLNLIAWNQTDTTEEGRFQINLADAGALNVSAYITGAGLLWVDVGVNADDYYQVAGTQVVSAQGAVVADATNATDVILRLNDLLARTRTHGLIATA